MAFLAAIPQAIGSFIGGAGLGGTLQAGASLLSGIGAFAAAQQQAKIAERNAQIANENALEAAEQAQREARESDNEIAAFIGQQEAIQSASGLLTRSRSSRAVRAQAARIGRQDARNIIEQGQVNTRNFFQQASDFEAEASQARASGTMGLLQGVVGGVSSLVGTASPTRSTLGAQMRQRRNDPWITRSGTNLRVRTI